MKLEFTKKGIVHKPINSWELIDGNTFVIYQGSRGGNPELDYIIKYKAPNKRLRAPSHTHWIFDVLLKTEYAKLEMLEYIKEWIEVYDIIEPFKTKEERENYKITYQRYFCEKYYGMEHLGVYTIEFLSTLIELFIKCEKQTEGAFMFKGLLKLLQDYCEDKKDFYQAKIEILFNLHHLKYLI